MKVFCVLFLTVTMLVVFLYVRRLGVFRKKIPSGKSFEILDAEYKKWDNRGVLMLFLIPPVASLGVWMLLAAIYEIRAIFIPKSVHFISVSYTMLFGIGASLSLFIMVWMFFSYLRRDCGKDAIREYLEYEEQKYPRGGAEVLALLAMVCVPLALLVAVLSMNSYTRITDDKIYINTLTTFREVEYSFSQITELNYVKSFVNSKGEVVDRPSYYIEFADGRMHDLYNSSQQLSLEDQKRIVSYLAEKAEMKVTVRALKEK